MKYFFILTLSLVQPVIGMKLPHPVYAHSLIKNFKNLKCKDLASSNSLNSLCLSSLKYGMLRSGYLINKYSLQDSLPLMAVSNILANARIEVANILPIRKELPQDILVISHLIDEYYRKKCSRLPIVLDQGEFPCSYQAKVAIATIFTLIQKYEQVAVGCAQDPLYSNCDPANAFPKYVWYKEILDGKQLQDIENLFELKVR